MRLGGLAGIVAVIVAACGSAGGSGATGTQQAASPLCPTFASIYAERDKLPDAYALAFAGRGADAETAAKGIAARIESAVGAMPAADGLSASDKSLRKMAAGDGIEVEQAAQFLEGLPDLPTLDEIVSGAPAAVEAGDATLRRFHDGYVSAACPGLALVIKPIAFPASSPGAAAALPSETASSPTVSR